MKKKSRYGPILVIGLLFMGALAMVNITPTAPLTLSKAGFDPVLLGLCFAVMALVAWWQKRRAFERDMIFCGTDTATMALPSPIVFGWGGSRASPARKKEETPQIVEETPVLHAVALEEDSEEETPEWREPFRASYVVIYEELFADLAHNPALRDRIYEKCLRAHRRDSDLIRKAYKETIFN